MRHAMQHALLRAQSLAALLILLVTAAHAQSASSVTIGTPGFATSHVAPDGTLTEDWGWIRLRLTGQPGIEAPMSVSPEFIDGIMPAARLTATTQDVALEGLVYRAPVWPAGLDVRRWGGRRIVERPPGLRAAGGPRGGLAGRGQIRRR